MYILDIDHETLHQTRTETSLDLMYPLIFAQGQETKEPIDGYR